MDTNMAFRKDSLEARAIVNGADYARELHGDVSRNQFGDLVLLLVSVSYPADTELQNVCIEAAFEQFDGMTRALDRAAEGF
jgi:hypothetical protein